MSKQPVISHIFLNASTYQHAFHESGCMRRDCPSGQVAADTIWAIGAGLLLSSQFNINYFGISEVDQWFGDFSDVWTQAGGYGSNDRLCALLSCAVASI